MTNPGTDVHWYAGWDAFQHDIPPNRITKELKDVTCLYCQSYVVEMKLVGWIIVNLKNPRRCQAVYLPKPGVAEDGGTYCVDKC